MWFQSAAYIALEHDLEKKLSKLRSKEILTELITDN